MRYNIFIARRKVMNVLNEKTIKALKTDFELIGIAGSLALLADLIWLSHDIYVSGISIWYSIVGLGLLSALLVSLFIIYRHNASYVKKHTNILTNKHFLHKNK
jgi:hypothetical protein